MEVSTTLQQMVKDLDTVLGIPANAEIIYKEDSEFGIILQLLRVFGHVLPGQAKKLIHHIAVVAKLTAVIHAAGFVAQGRCEI